jgi:signal transduction histidine kinase
MKIPILHSISRIGTSYATSQKEKSTIIITNQVGWLLTLLPLIYIAMNVYNLGWLRITTPIVTQPFLFFLPVLLNAVGMITTSRVWACWSMSVLALVFSIYNKSSGLDLETSHYMGIRFSILASAVIPFLVFQLKERALILFCLLPSFMSLMWFDFIHDLFDVGYYESGLSETGYSLTTMRVMIAYLLILGGSLFLKRLVERNEAINLELIWQLTEKNNEIQTQLEEISSQNSQISVQKEELEKQFKEITSQRDKLYQNETQLSKALNTIQTQQEILLNQNKSLEFEVLSKNKELSQNNQQLIRYNNELQQFSYTVSHNLRGPVATILGLINVIDQEQTNSPVHNHLKKTVLLLDETIQDLNRILDIRNEVGQIRQRVLMPSLVEKIKATFLKDIEQYNIAFKEEYKNTSELFSIHSLVNSIVYNLVSNAIKYRSSERRPEINIICSENSQHFLITIRDNGIGLDMHAHRERLFQLYRRFNTNTEGKGIGLYLVKLQTEMLGGTVDVTSELGQFTEFTIRLPLLAGS